MDTGLRPVRATRKKLIDDRTRFNFSGIQMTTVGLEIQTQKTERNLKSEVLILNDSVFESSEPQMSIASLLG